MISSLRVEGVFEGEVKGVIFSARGRLRVYFFILFYSEENEGWMKRIKVKQVQLVAGF